MQEAGDAGQAGVLDWRPWSLVRRGRKQRPKTWLLGLVTGSSVTGLGQGRSSLEKLGYERRRGALQRGVCVCVKQFPGGRLLHCRSCKEPDPWGGAGSGNSAEGEEGVGHV